jgi:hypothetical protein
MPAATWFCIGVVSRSLLRGCSLRQRRRVNEPVGVSRFRPSLPRAIIQCIGLNMGCERAAYLRQAFRRRIEHACITSHADLMHYFTCRGTPAWQTANVKSSGPAANELRDGEPFSWFRGSVGIIWPSPESVVGFCRVHIDQRGMSRPCETRVMPLHIAKVPPTPHSSYLCMPSSVASLRRTTCDTVAVTE